MSGLLPISLPDRESLYLAFHCDAPVACGDRDRHGGHSSLHINKSFKLLDSNGGLSVMLASTFATVTVNTTQDCQQSRRKSLFPGRNCE